MRLNVFSVRIRDVSRVGRGKHWKVMVVHIATKLLGQKGNCGTTSDHGSKATFSVLRNLLSLRNKFATSRSDIRQVTNPYNSAGKTIFRVPSMKL